MPSVVKEKAISLHFVNIWVLKLYAVDNFVFLDENCSLETDKAVLTTRIQAMEGLYAV